MGDNVRLWMGAYKHMSDKERGTGNNPNITGYFVDDNINMSVSSKKNCLTTSQ